MARGRRRLTAEQRTAAAEKEELLRLVPLLHAEGRRPVEIFKAVLDGPAALKQELSTRWWHGCYGTARVLGRRGPRQRPCGAALADYRDLMTGGLWRAPTAALAVAIQHGDPTDKANEDNAQEYILRLRNREGRARRKRAVSK
jgi:hypothetical protein